MKGLIIYATCYGSTEQYADWIKQEFPFEKKSYKNVTDDDLKDAELIIIGSWVLAHKLFLAKWIQDKADLFKGKPLYMYSVSGAKPGSKELDEVFSSSMDNELLALTNTYQFGGKREVNNMNLFHKFMMWIATTFIEKDPKIKNDMKKFVNNVDRHYIKPLIDDIKQAKYN